MIQIIQNSYCRLLARIALWSLVSLPCYWIPLFAGYYYTDHHSLGAIMCFSIPFLGLAAVMSIWSLVEVHKVLRPCPKGYRCALSAIALTLSAPTMVATGIVAFAFIVVTVYGVYMGLRGLVMP
jgi:hypothetical protein